MSISRALYSLFGIAICICLLATFFTAKTQPQTSFTLETFYGPLEINEPVIAELLQSKAVQRLKDIHQYGVMRYAVPTENYTRYEHSIGVYALLRKMGASLEEQIAGLLHDTSHTVFSHVGDFVFHHHAFDHSYQDDIHAWYLRNSGLADILEKYGYTIENIHQKSGNFKALEQDLPALCMDRIEYNLQGAVLREMIDYAQVEQVLDDLHFENDTWYCSSKESARILGDISLHMTEQVWGAGWNLLVYDWTGQALRKAMDIGLISYDDIHFSCDQQIWHRLVNSEDATIRDLISKVLNFNKHFELCDEQDKDIVLKGKFRGVDPLVKTENGLEPLTKIDEAYAAEYARVQQVMKRGWFIKLK